MKSPFLFSLFLIAASLSLGLGYAAPMFDENQLLLASVAELREANERPIRAERKIIQAVRPIEKKEEKMNQSKILLLLEQIGNEVDISIEKISFDFQETPRVSLELSGLFANSLRFLRNLQNHPHGFSIQSFEIKRTAEREGMDVVKIHIEIEI